MESAHKHLGLRINPSFSTTSRRSTDWVGKYKLTDNWLAYYDATGLEWSPTTQNLSIVYHYNTFEYVIYDIAS